MLVVVIQTLATLPATVMHDYDAVQQCLLCRHYCRARRKQQLEQEDKADAALLFDI